MNHPILNYKIELPDSVEQIIDSDWWVFTHLPVELLQPVKEAIKFTSLVSIFVSKGTAEIEINLLKVKIAAPCEVLIRPGEVVQLKYVSSDFDASFVVMSAAVRDELLVTLHDSGCPTTVRLDPVAPISAADVTAFSDFYDTIKKLSEDKGNPYRLQALSHTLLAFYFQTGYRGYEATNKMLPHQHLFRRNPLIDKFLILVQQNFKDERQIDFYAGRLGVTSKHLSRSLKQCTGFSAAEWIKKYLLLEAKVMLKSSTLSMGQISALLNFPSQSFFAKFFKNATGMTPKQFRNSPS